MATEYLKKASEIPAATEDETRRVVSEMLTEIRNRGEDAAREYGIELRPFDALADLDVVILAVSHESYLDDLGRIVAAVRDGGLIVDVKSALSPGELRADLRYWSL